MNIKEDVSKAWEDVPSPIRGGIYLVTAVGIGYLGYQWYKKYKIDQKAQEIKDQMSAYEKAGVRQTYPDSKYKALHDTIYDAVESFSNALHTDINSIYGVFQQLKNDVDFLMLQQYTYTVGWVWKQTYTLDEYLKEKLDESQIAQINNILKAKRINYAF